MSASDIAAVCTSVVAVLGAVTALVAQIYHVLHHDDPGPDEPADGGGGGQSAPR